MGGGGGEGRGSVCSPASNTVISRVSVIPRLIFSSPGLYPWRAYVVTQSLTSASVGLRVGVHIGVRVGVRVSTMFKFSKVCIGF